MDLKFNEHLAIKYKSSSQKIRVMSEDWVKHQGFCPNCMSSPLYEYANNQPVADFYCTNCNEQFELKSKKAKLSQIINDGAYSTMVERVSSASNPNFFFLTYSEQLIVNNFLIVPKHFFTPSIIIKRPPLAPTAKRAGWVGCNIDLRKLPESGKVFIVKNRQPIDRSKVVEQFQKTIFLGDQKPLTRGWTLEILKCIDKLPQSFSLKEIYSFSSYLENIYPENKNIKAKIRQQLQILRDKGFIEFLGKGRYKKTS